MGEHCYSTTYHMTIRMTPFRALYGYDASTFADRIFGDTRAPKAKEWIQEGQDILKILREHTGCSESTKDICRQA